jgi:L-2-hydroxyglutarate oxidase
VFDYLIIGGGIIGLSTAWQLQQREPDASIVLLEKEARFARHQTGHNSGVIHAGIYYEPGSLKARFCKAGLEATIRFCRENQIAYEQCGKLLVATDEAERQRMLALFERARENGLEVELLDGAALRALEPGLCGVGAILLKSTGIVDYRAVSEKLAQRFQALGGETRLEAEVTALEESADCITVHTASGHRLSTKFLISCTGLMADRTAGMLGIDVDFRIIPFRGEYYRLAPHLNHMIRHLIYPIPDPDLPFLGVHLTRMIGGGITVGPNAVQGWKREGYGRININLRDIREMIVFAGFWRLLGAHFGKGMKETWNSWWKPGYLRQVRKYCPSITLADLQPWPAGVRAQAVGKDGTMLHDFLFAQSPRSLHVCNAPSPAATSALPIGNHICELITTGKSHQSGPAG